MDNSITLYDISNDRTKMCSTNLDNMRIMKNDELTFVKHCSKYCPKKCFQIQYSTKYYEEEKGRFQIMILVMRK